MKAIENFENIRKRLGEEIFNELYENREPKEYDVIGQEDGEICILQPFLFEDGEKMLKIWTKKEDYTIKYGSCAESKDRGINNAKFSSDIKGLKDQDVCIFVNDDGEGKFVYFAFDSGDEAGIRLTKEQVSQLKEMLK